MFFITELLCLFAGLATSSALIAYDCGAKKVNITKVSLVTTPSCVEETHNITTSQVTVAVSQTTIQYHIEFFRCSVETQNVLGRCGKWHDSFFSSGFYSEFIPTTREQCRRMIQDRVYTAFPNGQRRDIMLSSNRHQTSFTSRGYVDNDGDCEHGTPFERNGVFYDRPLVNTQMTISYSTGKAIADIEERLIRFPNGGTCPLSDESCTLSDYGDIFWKVPNPSCSGENSENGIIYEGSASLIEETRDGTVYRSIQVTHDGYDFLVHLLPKTTRVCDRMTYYTEHPKLYATIMSRGDSLGLKRNVSVLNINLMNYINSKLVYSMKHVKQEVTRLYSIFSRERCMSNNRITQNMMTLARIAPSEFAYMYGGEGYTSFPSAAVSYIAKCHPVSVKVDHTVDGCYHELPVQYENKTLFMSPRSKILVGVGKRVECLPELLPTFFIDNEWWIRSDHGLIRVPPPALISPDFEEFEYRDLNAVVSGGIYKSDMFERYQKSLTSPMVEEAVQVGIVRAIEGNSSLPVGYSFAYGLSGADYKIISERIETSWEVFSKKATAAGSWVGFLILAVWVWKTLVYFINCFVNFRELNREVGVLLAIPICLFDSLCNMVLHGRILNRRRRVPANLEMMP